MFCFHCYVWQVWCMPSQHSWANCSLMGPHSFRNFSFAFLFDTELFKKEIKTEELGIYLCLCLQHTV